MTSWVDSTINDPSNPSEANRWRILKSPIWSGTPQEKFRAAKIELGYELKDNNPSSTYDFMYDELDDSQQKAFDALTAGDPNFKTALHNALAGNENLTDSILKKRYGLGGGNAIQSSISDIPAAALQQPYIAGAVSETLKIVAGNPNYDFNNFKRDVEITGRTQLQEHLSGAPTNQVFPILNQAAQVMASVSGKPVDPDMQKALNFLQTEAKPELRDAFAKRIQTKPDFLPRLIAHAENGSGGISVDDLKKVNDDNGARKAMVEMLNSDEPFDFVGARGKITAAAVTGRIKEVKEATEGLHGEQLFIFMKGSDLFGEDQETRDKFFGRFEGPENAEYKANFLRAIENHPSFGGMLSLMIEQDPNLADKLFLDSSKLENIGLLGNNTMKFLADHPEFDFSKIAEKLQDHDLKKLNFQKALELIKDPELNESAELLSGFVAALKQDAGDSWYSKFDKILEGMDPNSPFYMIGVLIRDMIPGLLGALETVFFDLPYSVTKEYARAAHRADNPDQYTNRNGFQPNTVPSPNMGAATVQEAMARPGAIHLTAAMDEAGVTNPQQRAYIMATAYHETGATMAPVRETFASSDAQAVRNLSGSKYAVPDPETGQSYFGRGYVQLTWKDNYAKLGKRLGVDLVNHPELALDPKISAQITVIGMKEGLFTGRSLDDYTGPNGQFDSVGARAIVNGSDRAGKIAGHYAAFKEITTHSPATMIADAKQDFKGSAAKPKAAEPKSVHNEQFASVAADNDDRVTAAPRKGGGPIVQRNKDRIAAGPATV